MVIKGLAFKKNTAHKHMPSSFKNPKLLLLKGVLGHSDAGLSSFNALGEVLAFVYFKTANSFGSSFLMKWF